MHYQNFNDFDIESSFQEDDNVVIDKPFIPAKHPKSTSPPPVRSTFKAPSDLSREEQLLSTVVHLDNGTTGYLITLNKTTGSWSCHACYPFKVPSLSLLEEHLTNKMHLLEMGKSCFPAKNFIRACSETGISVGMPSMVSGEPIPPGMEDEVDNVLARIQATLDSIFIPLIGIEFILELLPSEPTEEPRYMCALCDKRGDPRTFPNHLRSFNHHMAYLRRYFRSLASALEKLNKVSSKGFQELVFHVIGKIEETYGRMKPIVVDASLFDLSTEKIKILRQVNNGKHIMENPEDLWMLDMIKSEFVENPSLLQEKFPLKKVTEKNKRDEEEKQKAIKAETSFNKNPRIAVNKSQLRPKNDKEESDSDIEFVDIKPNTESKPRKRISSRDSKDRRRRSPPRRHRRSRSPVRHKSRTRSKTPVMVRPRSRSRSLGRSRSRSRSPYYNRNNKYSSHRRRYRSRERDESYRRQISPSPNVHHMHSMSGYVSGHPHPRMFYAAPYMSFPRPFMRFPPPNRPRFYSPDMYSAEYHTEKERNSSKRKRLIQEYEKAVEEMKIEMEKKLSYHEKNPENHPLYPDEWKKFWNRRFKELQMEGKDPSTYDFKPEWILSWSKRTQEMHDEEINEKMEKLKNKILGDINMDKSSSESPSRDSPPLKDKKLIIDSKHSWHNIPVSEVFERDSDIVINKPSNDKKPRVAGASPINSDSEDSINEINDHNKPREKIKIENPLNVITVLRQLSVLESQLGLLAPKIVDLLSKGLVMEKIEPKSSIKLLTPDNCVMFETVKEKLKGQLLAGVVKRSLVNATMFSIRNIEKLMQLAPKFIPTSSMLNSTPTSIPTPVPTPIHTPIPIPKTAPIIVPGVGIIDKMAIAQQITQALLAQGRVDVSQNDLETLINAVVGMAQSGDNIQGAKNLLANINNGDVMKTAYEEVDKKEEVEKINLDQLSQGDIINLLKNFRDLNTDEQDGLITYLKKLGEKKPEEVKKLRKYIDMGPSNLKEVTSMFKEDDDDDDDNYELSDVCKAVTEKVSEQKDEDVNNMSVNFEITEEQQKLLSSIKHFLPEIKSDYSLEPTNTQMQTTPDQSFYKSPNNEPHTTSYSLDPYSAKKNETNNYSPQPSTSTTFLTDQPEKYNVPQENPNKYNKLQEQPNKYSKTQDQLKKYNKKQEQPSKYNLPQELPNKYNMSQEQPSKYNISQEPPNKYNMSQEQPSKYNISQEPPNKYVSQDPPNKYMSQELLNKYSVSQEPPSKYNIPQEEPNEYNTAEEQSNEYNISPEKPDPYSANQVDNYNDPYSQNRSNNYYQGQQQDSYNKYHQNASSYYKGKNTYKTNNTYPDTYQGTSRENNRNNRFNRGQNNRFQSRR
ncbi:LOW QUALITY PROTEIN: uncharacterized protein LOC132942621 [Metopolophium dirhodum]|uniref:LOW QUALITY PROTEIN: uncharacterized protein LOC132942621 n=1 Tax=Metopolophium dirhodum TaxID=44670 RepID=UPI00298F96BB|nr:LOW QUALITY PROTEIN: uncharacterized protein LOC132942621 [Metopolophium dirhodum]